MCFKGEKCNIIAVIRMLNHKFHELVIVDDQRANHTSLEKFKWNKPLPNIVKLNVDLACSSDSL